MRKVIMQAAARFMRDNTELLARLGNEWDEAVIKDLSRSEPIVSRRMRAGFWAFNPTHKLYIMGATKPEGRR